MPTEMHWYNGGTWKKAQQMFVWNGTEWKEAFRMYIWNGSTWKLCHETGCFPFDATSITSMADCSTALNFTYSSNCADPAADYGSVTCYLYADSTCTAATGDAFSQIQIGITTYNVDTNSSSIITDVQLTPC